MKLDWHGTALPHQRFPSPNINERRGGGEISILLLHYTGMETATKARHWLCAQESGVSCHYLIDENGTITQMVDERMRAWHAGNGSWHGVEDVNSRSIGIEIQNPGHSHGYEDFPEAQMISVARPCQDIAKRNHIAARNILAHSDIAPRRKIDPGEKFSWQFLHNQGIGHWVPPAIGKDQLVLKIGDQGPQVLELQSNLKTYGYGIQIDGKFGPETKAVVSAFQRHFRPQKVDGCADASTRQTLLHLIRAV